jgi:hypothetical protein
MTVDAFSTQSHYVAHMAPIWHGLGEHMGTFFTAGLLGDLPNTEGIARKVSGYPTRGGGLTLVAGYMDEQALTRPMVYLEHGAGQTYGADAVAADHPAYSGTPGHDRVRLFLCPSAEVAARWRMRYPRADAVAVGCPKMDRFHRHARAEPWVPPGPNGREPVVAITFHSNNVLCPESTTAFPHYRDTLPAAIGALRQAGIKVIGHGHPRLWRTLGRYWEELQVEAVEDLGEVFQRADVLIGDNTSAIPEFASLGRPVVFMNAPWYRRTVEHGGRFWDWPVGQISVDSGREIPAAVIRALAEDPDVVAARNAMVRDVYGECDGHATARAVAAIVAVAPPMAAPELAGARHA